MTVSFDIFDTCFVRACGRPDNVFGLLAADVLGAEADETRLADFALTRKKGEQAARANARREEVTLEDIYRYCDFSGMTAMPNSDIAAAECRIEREVLIPVLSVKRIIEKYRLEGRRIMFVSDTYLPEAFIMSLLVDNDFWHDGDLLYVSSAALVCKSTGNLYKHIAQSLGLEYSSWLHFGDNSYSDIAVPRKLGMAVRRVEHGYTAYQRRILNGGTVIKRRTAERLASVSRGLMLSLPENERYAFACDLIAPLYVPFVCSIMEDAAAKGIGRLFFLSRDGYILYKIACEVQKHCFRSLELSYLNVSRCSLYMAGSPTGSDDEFGRYLRSILKEGKDFCRTLAELLPEELYSAILQAQPALTQGSEDSIGLLLGNEQALSLLKSHIVRQKELAAGYFRQEGLADMNVKTAVVDLRGTGRCSRTINNILAEYGYPRSFGYYLEVMDNRCLSDGRDPYKAFLRVGDNLTSLGGWFEIASSVLEDYYSASPHKSTTHYGTEGDRIVPLFNDASFSAEAQEVFSCNESVAVSFARYYCRCGLCRENDYCFALGVGVASDFFDDPDGYYLSALRNMGVGFYHHRPQQIVRALRFCELWRKSEGWEKGSFFLTLYMWRNRIKNLGNRVRGLLPRRKNRLRND